MDSTVLRRPGDKFLGDTTYLLCDQYSFQIKQLHQHFEKCTRKGELRYPHKHRHSSCLCFPTRAITTWTVYEIIIDINVLQLLINILQFTVILAHAFTRPCSEIWSVNHTDGWIHHAIVIDIPTSKLVTNFCELRPISVKLYIRHHVCVSCMYITVCLIMSYHENVRLLDFIAQVTCDPQAKIAWAVNYIEDSSIGQFDITNGKIMTESKKLKSWGQWRTPTLNADK